jgi:class 3 adenylate cyclase/tetratricopeptide (TPR) repeat protein
LICPNCGTNNPADRKFCGECGTALALLCPNCGAPNEPRFKFCGECGTPLPGAEAGAVAASAATPSGQSVGALSPTPVSERRLVAVLFADLVGFTALSEKRDPDEVRELLSQYFDTCRQQIGRYGGTVEKFIGDAVMAVWGTPVAQEDDAERAVRAALELVQAVRSLGENVGAGDLNARVGVLTGEAAVTLGAEGQGMVAGALVNTASRVQSVAEPGTVLVGEATRRSTEAAIMYEPAGLHDLKGKVEPLPLWRALRVVAGVRGQMKSAGLEAPFVGRDRELRLVKELFHETVDNRKAHMLSVIGIAGIGKSRLAWEYFKYMDGLQQVVWWHRGRCLAYGEGVTYWALAEMVRGRADIIEGEDEASSVLKLRACVADLIEDPDERAWVEPRLAHLLGLEERTAREPEDLFSAWRLFFERLAERNPTAMVFEDMQWADRGLLDFIDYLMNWSRNHPFFIIALARPEIAERHPDWSAGRRGSTTLHLEPLSDEDMERLLTGLVPGLPEAPTRQILDRAQGVPLYAVETVRMLLDRGLLAPEGAAYRLTGEIEKLEVPETLHALIAARLDGLAPAERSLLQDASVIGKTFTKSALSALTGLSEQTLEPLLISLIRKEILGIQADSRSSERGQYGFLQDLVRQVAYEMLSTKERKARHLAAAAHMESEWGGEEVEIVEVLASHYLEAYRAAPGATDADAIKAKARDALVQAGRRSESLAASHQAYGYYLQAIELTDDPLALADLHERAGVVVYQAGSPKEAPAHYEEAIALFKVGGQPRDAARVTAKFADTAFSFGRLEEAAARMQEAYDVLSEGESDEALGLVAMQLARMLHFSGRTDEAFERNEHALDIGERLQLPEVLSEALNSKGVMLWTRGRREEAFMLLRHALKVALDNEIYWAAVRAYNNLAATASEAEQFEESLQGSAEARELSRKLGFRTFELNFIAGDVSTFVAIGRWDDALARVAEFEASAEGVAGVHFAWNELISSVEIHVHRGELAEARRLLERFAELERSDEVQTRSIYTLFQGIVARAEGRPKATLEAAESVLAQKGSLGLQHWAIKGSLVQATEAALALGDPGKAAELIEEVGAKQPQELTPSLRGQRARLQARINASQGEHEGVKELFQTATSEFRGIPMPFWLAVTLLEHAEWLMEQGCTEEAAPLLVEARDLFEGLRAQPWIERAAAASAQLVEEPASAAPA